MKKALLLIALIFVVMLYGCKQQGTQEESQKPEETATEPAKGMEGQPAEPAGEGTEPSKEGTEPVPGPQGTKTEPGKEQPAPDTKAMPPETGKDEPAMRMEGQPAEPIKEGVEPAKGEEQGRETSQGEQAQPIDGAQLFKAKTCGTCHQPNVDTAGPSLQKIAQIYKEQNANLVAFLKGEAPAIVDPSKADMMKPLLAHVKSLSEEEIKALADYILR